MMTLKVNLNGLSLTLKGQSGEKRLSTTKNIANMYEHECSADQEFKKSAVSLNLRTYLT